MQIVIHLYFLTLFKVLFLLGKVAAFFYRNQSASSVWLTSFVAQMLQEASFYEWENFIYIDPEVI